MGSLEYLIAFGWGSRRAVREKENRKGWGGEEVEKKSCPARGQGCEVRPGLGGDGAFPRSREA